MQQELKERLATYLVRVANMGHPMPMNIARSASKRMGCSVSACREAQGQLVVEGRLRGFNYKMQSIDGVFFHAAGIQSDAVEQIKDILRRFFPMVIDPRTVSDPTHVAHGVPEDLMLGSIRMKFTEACELAERLVNPQPSEPPPTNIEREVSDESFCSA